MAKSGVIGSEVFLFGAWMLVKRKRDLVMGRRGIGSGVCGECGLALE